MANAPPAIKSAMAIAAVAAEIDIGTAEATKSLV